LNDCAQFCLLIRFFWQLFLYSCDDYIFKKNVFKYLKYIKKNYSLTVTTDMEANEANIFFTASIQKLSENIEVAPGELTKGALLNYMLTHIFES